MLVHVGNRMCTHIEYRRIAFPYGKVTAGSLFNVLCSLILLRTLCDHMLSRNITEPGNYTIRTCSYRNVHSLLESQVIDSRCVHYIC